jgi:hypothetical protein
MSDETEVAEELPQDHTVFYLVHNASGQILRHGNCPESWLALQGMGDTVLKLDQEPDLSFDAKFYVVDGNVVTKANLEAEAEYTIAADGVASVSFTLPADTRIDYRSELHDAGNSFGFTTDTPGDYRFFFWTPVGYCNKEVIIHAV